MATIETVTLREPGLLETGLTAEPDAPRPGQTLVRIHRVGVCGTDIHAYRGRQPFFTYPRIPGHELGVEVLAAPAAPGALPVGTRCAVEPYLWCGACDACLRGRTNCCATLQVLGVHCDGGMRERILVPNRALHSSAELEYEALALVETLCIGFHAIRRANPDMGETVLVVGAGPIGLATAQSAILRGARVVLMDTDARRLAAAGRMLKLDAAVQPGEDARAALLAAFHGALPTVVCDATGNAESMQNCFGLVGQGGRLVLVGLVLGNLSFTDAEFHRREMTLLATRNATAAEFRNVIALLEAGRIDASAWITHRASSSEFPRSLPLWLEQDSGLIKGVVEF